MPAMPLVPSPNKKSKSKSKSAPEFGGFSLQAQANNLRLLRAAEDIRFTHLHQRQLPVLVYGTLRRDYGNHRLLREVDAEFHSEGWLPGFALFGAGIPVAIAEDAPAKIWVERFDIPAENWEAALRRLDRLESEGFMYFRVEVEFNGVACWMYLGDFAWIAKNRKSYAKQFARYEEMAGDWWRRPVWKDAVVNEEADEEGA
jgi:gamma-glutamylcyclotransferase (GGCT)/AIG2-like uncharacterized protein YtfP